MRVSGKENEVSASVKRVGGGCSSPSTTVSSSASLAELLFLCTVKLDRNHTWALQSKTTEPNVSTHILV